MPVAVCAWCKPKERGTEIGAVSHGICLRHLRNIKLELQGAVTKPRRRRSSENDNETLLPL